MSRKNRIDGRRRNQGGGSPSVDSVSDDVFPFTVTKGRPSLEPVFGPLTAPLSGGDDLLNWNGQVHVLAEPGPTNTVNTDEVRPDPHVL